MDKRMASLEEISLFCRLTMNTKRNIPIRSSEMGMLIYLVKTDEEKTPKAIAEFFQFTKSMATNMATSLIRQGYIEKLQSQTDKRSFYLKPTDQAIQLVDETYQEYFKLISLLEEKMDAIEFEQLITLLKKANLILKEERNHG